MVANKISTGSMVLAQFLQRLYVLSLTCVLNDLVYVEVCFTFLPQFNSEFIL